MFLIQISGFTIAAYQFCLQTSLYEMEDRGKVVNKNTYIFSEDHVVDLMENRDIKLIQLKDATTHNLYFRAEMRQEKI